MHTVTAKVRRPDDVRPRSRDPERPALTQTLTWTVKDAANTPGAAEPATITGARRTSARWAATTSCTPRPPPGRRQRRRRHVEARRHRRPEPRRRPHLDLRASNLPGAHTLTATVGRRHPDLDGRRHRRRDHVHDLEAEGDREPARRRDPRVHLRGPVHDEAHRDRRQAGLRRARVPGRRRRLAATTTAGRPTPTRRSSSPHGHRDRPAQLRQARLRPAHHRVPGDRRRRATSPRPRSSRSPTSTRRRARSAGRRHRPGDARADAGRHPPTFGAFTPGLAKDYTASMSADVISTAGDAALSVADPSRRPGHLVNGSFSLPTPLKVNASSPRAQAEPWARAGDAPDLLRAGLPRSGRP